MTRNAAAILFDSVLVYTLEVGVQVCLSATKLVVSGTVIMKESV